MHGPRRIRHYRIRDFRYVGGRMKWMGDDPEPAFQTVIRFLAVAMSAARAFYRHLYRVNLPCLTS